MIAPPILLALACSGGAPPAEAPPATPAVDPSWDLPAALEAPHRVATGWGCGGNCAFRAEGESRVRLEALEGGGVVLSDSGSEVRSSSWPDHVEKEVRTWDLSWQGRVRREGEARLLDLGAVRAACEIAVDDGRGGEPRLDICSAPARLELRCVPGAVDAAGSSRRALVCEVPPEAELPGSRGPWAFGLDGPIWNIDAGEPEPDRSYGI